MLARVRMATRSPIADQSESQSSEPPGSGELPTAIRHRTRVPPVIDWWLADIEGPIL
jgi:hypothetical protein